MFKGVRKIFKKPKLAVIILALLAALTAAINHNSTAKKSTEKLRRQAIVYQENENHPPVPEGLEISGKRPKTWKEVLAQIEADAKRRVQGQEKLKKVRRAVLELKDFLVTKPDCLRYSDMAKKRADAIKDVAERMQKMSEEERRTITIREFRDSFEYDFRNEPPEFEKFVQLFIKNYTGKDSKNALINAAKSLVLQWEKEVLDLRRELQPYLEISKTIEETMPYISGEDLELIKKLGDGVQEQLDQYRRGLDRAQYDFEDASNFLNLSD